MPGKNFAYFYNAAERQITVGTSEAIENLYAGSPNIHYCCTEEELADNVQQYYRQECIVTLTSRLHTFENKLFL
ncbi:hypothetical protein [Salibacterium aidingense]|uniref:hypothetical protein n=1 Tax=Salibacterium aidingense TaxID=384933 RepID=UPI00041B0B14|nr:hypothetical protein [Salibacterium aidingense]